MIIKIINEFSSDYNQVAKHPLQSWAWGEARKAMGIEVLRVGKFYKNKLIHVFQLTIHQLPLTNLKIGYLPRSVIPSKQVLQFLFDYGKKNKIIFIKIEPYEAISNPHLKSQNLIKSSHPLFPDWTLILDLNKSEDELLKNMHPKTRYNIKLAQRKGVIIKEMSNDAGFDIFSRLYFETCKRQKYFGHTPIYHKIIWKNLKNNIAHILIAYYKNTPLAAYELFYFNKIIYYPYGGSSLEYRNFMAANLLMWEAVRLGKQLGAIKFDFWGSLHPKYNLNHPWAGFSRFKQGYGGSFVNMVGSYDLIINPIIYQLYNYSYLIRQLYLKIKREQIS